MRSRTWSWNLWTNIVLLACLTPAQRDADAASQQQCASSIRWQYPVRIELLLSQVPQPDLFGATPPGQDLSTVQIRVYDYKRTLVLSKNLGPDSVFFDSKWTPVEDLFLEWGRYSLEAQGPRILTFAKNVTLPHDAQCGLFSSCIAAAPSQQLRQISERQGAEFSEETGGSKLLRATANARFVSAIAGPRGVVVDDSLRKTIDRSEVLPGTGETSPSISLRKLLDAGEVGRRSGVGGCGGVGQQACICHEDFCCMAPPEVRSPNKIYVDEWETLDGRNAKVACTFGVCNVTLDEVVAPGCQSYSCRLTTCQSNDGKCSLFTPQSCSTCERCLEIGLGSWCANATINSTTLYGIQSQECQNVQGNNDDGECTLTSGDPGRTCSTCDDQCGKVVEVVPSTTPAPTPPPVADWDRTCRLLEDNMPQNPTECDYLIRSMWCEEDCAVDFGILSSAHASIGRQPLSAADRHVLCNSPCYFTKYHDYLQRIDSSNCQRNLDASFAPPDPYVLRGYLPGNVPSQVSDLTRFAETICIYTEPTPEDDTDGYCLDIITTVGRESKVEEECTNIPIDTNFSTWQCPVRCTFALSRFFESAGCCLYNLEYPRYAMAGYPFFLKDLARACKITENVLALDQPCVGALASDCGTKSVCLGVSATGGYILSNGMRVGEGDSCLCTGANHDIQNVSGILSCVDKDECLLGESTCHQYATCINTLGSHHCQCNDGFEGDGRMCTAKPCGFFEEEKETCILCDEKCCNLNDIKFATYTQVVDIGCRLGTENVRDLYRRLVSSPSRFDEGTCVENVTASLVDCRGNESVLDMPCALWAKHDYFCTNLSYPTQYLADLEEEHRTEFAEYSDALAQVHAQMREIPYHANCSNGTLANGTNCTESNYTLPQAPTPPTRGWGQTQFWCLRNASGGMCGHNSSKVTRVVSEMDGVGIKAQAMCQADGTYNATIRCERISCGRYTAPASGLVEGDWVGPPQAVSPRDMFYPESVDIVCNVGYYATYDGARLSVGSPFLSSDCLSDSSYSVTPPRLACVPIVCGGFLDFIELTANVIIYREDSSMYPPNVTVCKSDEAEFCREDSQCCECLGRLRDCSSATSDGCRECNKCAGCIAITTVCPDVCANQALLPALVVDGHRSYSYGERVALECEEGYELSRVLKDTNISPLGEREPMCIANAVTLEPVFEIGMSCLAKPCLPLTVANGVVMPDTKQCNSEFSSCVARKWDETMGVDDNGFPLDIDKLCMGELQSIEPCKAETQVLYGANIRIVCELGYTNGTAATLRPFCTSNGSFSNHAICEKKSCGIFRALNNSVSEEWNGRDVRYRDTVTMYCSSGYSPIEQTLYCDETGTLETPDTCGLMYCGELYTNNAKIQCTTGARNSPSQDMVYGDCDPDGNAVLNVWETFQYPNEFYILCNAGFQHFPAPPEAYPETRCTINGSYTPFPQCLDLNECETDVFGPATEECEENSTLCTNNGGSYTCECLPGYESRNTGGQSVQEIMQSQVSCEDINECEVSPEECDRHATCFNTPGSFFCSCNTGYGPAGYGGDGKDCKRLVASLRQAPSSGIASIAGIGLSNQPRIAIQSVNGDVSPTPWDQLTQTVTVSLVQMTGDGSGPQERTSLLMGNLTADAATGIAAFTDLDVILVGSGYQLQFSMLSQWRIDPVFTGTFSVKSGPAARLSVLVEPSTSATTTQLLTKQPQVELTDMFGNSNPDSIPTVVSVKITPVDPEAPPGWQGGLVDGAEVLSEFGVAKFTELTLYGIGTWTIDFEAELNFRQASVRAAQEIILNQLVSKAMQIIFAMDINQWSTDIEEELIATMSRICGLDTAAFEIMDVAAGSVILGLAFHVPDPAPYWKLAADDLINIPSALSGLGVISLSAPGITAELDMPLPPLPPVPPKPYTGIPLDVVSFWTEVTQAFVITGYGVGIIMTIFSEVAASFATATRISELANPEGEPAHGNRWHTGAGIFSGGAFRCFITQVQFIAALSSLGGRGGQPQFFFAYPYPTDRPGNWSFHDQSLIADVRLPIGARTLAETLDWTNLRSNVTVVLGDANIFPRPCDVYAQQVTIGTCFLVIFIQVAGYFARTIVHKIVEKSTLWKYGEASTSAALTFPKWESLVITNTYYGITQVVGICIGSFCTDWMIGGICLGLFPLGSCFVMTYYTYQATSGYQVVKFVPTVDEVTEDGDKRKHRLKGKWKRQLDVSDSKCSTSMRYLMMFSSAFNDMRDGYAVYYGSFSMLLRMIVGITSGAAHDWRISAYAFLALYGLDLIVLFIVYPYIDIIRNRMEVLLAMMRIGLVIVGFLYLRSNLDTDTSEAALFWLGIGSIGIAFLYQAVEIGKHIWSIAQGSAIHKYKVKKILERRKSHLSIHSVIDDNEVVVPHSLTAFKNVSLYDDMGNRHQILDKRYQVVKVTIQGASGLRSIDCRRHRTVCIAKIGQNDFEDHHRNFGQDRLTFHESETVYKTKSEGLTLTAHSAWWNETFPVQIDNNEGIMTFIVWECTGGEDWRNLGTAIVQLEPLLDELHTMPQPLEKKYPLVLHSKNAAEKKRQLQSSLSSPEKKDDIVTHFKASTEELDVGQLSLAFECNFARLWPLANSHQVHDYRLSTLGTTYVGLELQDTIKPPAKYSRSEDVRQALVGRHYQTAVSRSAAADNAKGLADVTWRFEENLSLTSPTIWDRGMPEGDENERQGYYNLIESKIVLHEGPGDFVSRAKANELHHVVRRDGERNKEQGRVEPTVNRSGRARPSAGALTGPQPAHESSYESGHMKNPLLEDVPQHGTEEVEVAI